MAWGALSPREAVLDLLECGHPLGIHTLKASVLTKDRGTVEAAVNQLVAEGLVGKLTKNRYVIAYSGMRNSKEDN